MARTRELSLAFAETHPADAARVLEHLTAENAAAFLSLLPARLGAPVMRHMLPTAAARCLEQLDDESASGLVNSLDAQAGSAILRYVGQLRRELLMTQLPTASALAFRLLLTYPEDTVGAWINPYSLAVTPDTPVTEALERLRQSSESGIYLYVVNADQRLLGMAALTDLLRARRGVTLGQVMRPTRHHLSARASLSAARDSEGWRELHALPVVERQGRFIGALDFPVLCRAIEQPREHGAAPPAAQSMTIVARAYWLTFANLLQALISLLPAAPPVAKGKHDAL